MEDFLKLFSRDNLKVNEFRKKYEKLFGSYHDYPLHPPHAMSKEQLMECGVFAQFAIKRDGVNAFLFSNMHEMWLVTRNMVLKRANIGFGNFVADLEMCEDRIYVLDACIAHPSTIGQNMGRRTKVRNQLANMMCTRGIVAESQKFYSVKMRDQLLHQAEEGLIVASRSSLFPTAHKTTFMKYKKVETIDVEIVPSCRVHRNAALYNTAISSKCHAPHFGKASQVAICRGSGDRYVILSVNVPPGPCGLYECEIRERMKDSTIKLVRKRYRSDKKYPNRWSIIKSIATRMGFDIRPSNLCSEGAHVFYMLGSEFGTCTKCSSSFRFDGEGKPVCQSECDVAASLCDFKKAPSVWKNKLRIAGTPGFLMLEIDHMYRPWAMSREDFCSHFPPGSGYGSIRVGEWYDANRSLFGDQWEVIDDEDFESSDQVNLFEDSVEPPKHVKEKEVT